MLMHFHTESGGGGAERQTDRQANRQTETEAGTEAEKDREKERENTCESDGTVSTSPPLAHTN